MYFNAKTKTGKWITGTPIIIQNKTYIVDTGKVVQFESGVVSFYTTEVEPKTIGKFTHTLDSNNDQLFENHVIKVSGVDDVGVINHTTNYGFYIDFYGAKGTMTEGGWNEDGGGTGVVDTWALTDLNSDFEIIGNIFDNSELLG